MLRPSMRGGVPVFRRPCGSCSSLSRWPRNWREDPCPPSGIVLQPHVNQTVEEGPSRQHHGTGTKAQPDLRNGAHHLVALHHQIVHRLLEQPEVGLVLELCTYGVSVQHPVGLGTRGTYRWPLGLLRIRNWIPASSVAIAIAPPNASTSLTK